MSEEYGPRPVGCCGKCPPIVGGGYDCTCEDNPRCPVTAADRPPVTDDAPRADGRTTYEVWAPDGTPPHIIHGLLAIAPDLGEDDE